MSCFENGCPSQISHRQHFDIVWFYKRKAIANETQDWLDNPLRKGTDDMGRVYGVIAKDFGGVDLIHKVYNNLKKGVDDRREIITFLRFWLPIGALGGGSTKSLFLCFLGFGPPGGPNGSQSCPQSSQDHPRLPFWIPFAQI